MDLMSNGAEAGFPHVLENLENEFPTALVVDNNWNFRKRVKCPGKVEHDFSSLLLTALGMETG